MHPWITAATGIRPLLSQVNLELLLGTLDLPLMILALHRTDEVESPLRLFHVDIAAKQPPQMSKLADAAIHLERAHERDHPDDEYRVQIQISELNALNAALAVIKFKQIRGFYFEEEALNSLVLEVGDLKTANEVL